MLRQGDFVNAQLVLAGWRHGNVYGSELASKMIMHCINNRCRVGWGNMLDIIQRIPNFSATLKQPEQTYPSIWEPAFVRLLHAVEGIVSGSDIDLSCGALYWADLREIDNPWFIENIMNRPDIHGRLADMNTLVFFK